jgi:hypothetical protein
MCIKVFYIFLLVHMLQIQKLGHREGLKNCEWSRAWWLTPATLATWEVEIITV